jgi:hypothetical protein
MIPPSGEARKKGQDFDFLHSVGIFQPRFLADFFIGWYSDQVIFAVESRLPVIVAFSVMLPA